MRKETIKRKSCYLCTTPLQVLGAIALEKEKQEGADIFLFDDNSDYLSLGSRLRAANIFENVYCIDFYSSMKRKSKTAAQAVSFFRMAACSRYVNRVTGDSVTYEKLYSSSAAVSKMVVASGLYKKNPSMKVSMCDDGIGSYSKAGRVKTGSALFQKAKRILKWKDILEKPEAIYLYQPELYESESETDVRRMPVMRLSSDSSRLAGIFTDENPDSLLIREKILIFDTFRSQSSNAEALAALDEVYRYLGETFGADELILKEHPRSTVRTEAPMKKYAYTSVPIEIVYMRQPELEDKILLALNSTAVFTPKMLFGAEPHVILLYRLVSKDPEIRKKRDDTFLHLRSLYEDQSRFCIPETFEELKAAITEWRSESGEGSRG